jgi:hypothetical protein
VLETLLFYLCHLPFAICHLTCPKKPNGKRQRSNSKDGLFFLFLPRLAYGHNLFRILLGKIPQSPVPSLQFLAPSTQSPAPKCCEYSIIVHQLP